jgi:hypothetical protein
MEIQDQNNNNKKKKNQIEREREREREKERNLEFKELALDKAQDEAGFPGAHVAEQNLVMRSPQVTIFAHRF